MAEVEPEPVGSLWDQVPPSTSDPHSKAAAAAMRAPAGNLRRAVLMSIATWGPIAEWEIERQLGMSGNTVRPRIWELRKAGLVERSTAKGVTPSLRVCWQYVVTLAGARELESWRTATR